MKERNKGITLITLIITIIVMLILVAVSVNIVIKGGIFESAKTAAKKTGIESLRERIGTEILKYTIENAQDPTINEEWLWQRLEDIDIIDNKDENVSYPPEEGENGEKIYIIETTSDYEVEIIVNSNGNISIGEIVKKGEGKTKVRTIKVQTHRQADGTGTIDVTATIRNIADGDKIAINYKLSSDESYSNENKIILDKADKVERSITGLTNGAKYDIIVEVVDGEGNSKEPRIYKEKLEIVAGKKLVEEIKLSTEGVAEGTNITAKVKVDKQIVLTAIALPEEAEEKTVTWTSSDSEATEKNVELIIKGNTVTIEGKKIGEITITATAADGSGVIATCTLTVERYVHTPVALDDDLGYTWEEVSKIAKAISDDDENINNNTMELTKEIDGKDYTVGLGDTMHIEINEEDYLVRIIGFNHDQLSDTSAYGGENLYAGITFNSLSSIGSFSRRDLVSIRYEKGT